MRRDLALVTMLLAEALVLALGLMFYLHTRRAILAAFRAYGTPLPPTAAVALSSWFLPGTVGVAIVATALALAVPLRRSRRTAIVGTAVFVACAALIFTVWAAVVPIFRPE